MLAVAIFGTLVKSGWLRLRAAAPGRCATALAGLARHVRGGRPAMTTDLPRAALIPLLLATAGAGVAGAAPLAPTELGAKATPRFGPYDLLRELGRGGMGVVYLAEERDADRRLVALKVALQAPTDPDLRAQLAFEREALAALAHDNVVRLFDAGTTPDGHPWLAMEYVDGEPLDEYCARRDLTLGERVALVADAARAVHHLHERGVVHRDVKPENILVTEVDGRPVPKLIDLGFAALSTTPADAHVVAGTPDYMAPELFADQPRAPDPRSDVFALGVVSYELIAGTSPFARRNGGSTGFDIGLAAGGAQPPTMFTDTAMARGLRRAGLDTAILRALASDPSRRPADGGAFARELETVLAASRARRGPMAWLGSLLRVRRPNA
ncbi:MAG: serine/threonine-protein kinase [Planctomycetota bacterium]